MQIREMFTKPIDREIQGVIIVGQDEKANVQQELEEYVVTNELQSRFADFFAAYRKGITGTTPKMGAWISGFFGSGKSHFLKILSYLLENREVGGKRAIDYFIDDKKIVDPMVLADIQLAAQTPTDVVLFNIDAKSDAGSEGSKAPIVGVFLRVFNEMQGFCGAMPALADLERKLTEAGRYPQFKEAFEAEYGAAWEASRQDFDFIQDTIVDVLSAIGFMSEQAARNWCEKATEPYSISIEDFAKRVRAYIEEKGSNHHVVFLVDEVGQYIGDDSQLMLNMQTVTEELGKECRGKAWIIVTSQQDIDSVTHVQGRDFSKIQGRFDTRLSLSSANVDAVIKKRILEKNETAGQMLRLLYGQKATIIKNLIVFNDGVEKKLYAGEEDFSRVYPFVPYQFNLLASVLTSIRTHGASGKHLSEGERSMLAMFKESAMAYMNHSEGTLIPFHAFYDAMETFLDHSHRSVIIKAYENGRVNPEGKKTGVFAVDVLKTLFMIKYCNDLCQANLDNITSLMINAIDDDRIALKAKVAQALKVLMGQMLVQKNGEIYIFLTDEEQEINREIDSQNVEPAETIGKVSEMIFEDIFPDKKYRYPKFNGRYAFGFNQIVDDRPYKANQHYDIGVNILTPASEIATEPSTLRMKSGQGQEVLVVLPDDRAFMDEIRTAQKIDKFLRLGTGAGLSKFESIKEAKRLERRERNENARLFLTESLKAATIYAKGAVAQLSAKEPSSRINEAIGSLVEKVYSKLNYIDAPMGEDDIRKLMRAGNQITLDLEGGKEANTLALDEVLLYVDKNTKEHVKTSMKTLKDRFMKAPYGFVEDDVEWLVARLFKRGDLTFTVNGANVTLMNKSDTEIVDLITKKANVEKLLMERRIRVSDRDKKIVRDVMKELFGTAPVGDDEDAVMKAFQRLSQNRQSELRDLEYQYKGGAYPGKAVVEQGKALLAAVAQQQTPTEFFGTVAGSADDLMDFSEDYEPVKAFFGGEQKDIFDKALKMLAIYDDSKTYIVDKDLEATIARMKAIVHEPAPYRDIPKLPELVDQFRKAYNTILDGQAEPVLDAIGQAQDRVMEVLDTRAYKVEKQEEYRKLFREIKDGAQRCNNVSTLRSHKDKAEALKIRLLDEINRRDEAIARKAAAEAKAERQRQIEAARKAGTPVPPAPKEPPAPPKIRTTKTVSLKTVAKTASWHLESEADIDSTLEALRKNLKAQLDGDVIVNVEL